MPLRSSGDRVGGPSGANLPPRWDWGNGWLPPGYRHDAPPILLVTGDREKEMLGPYEENAYCMRMLKLVGHKDVTLYELQGYGHNMVEPALKPMLEWLRNHAGGIPR